jgi:hypothetical protein
MSFQPGEHAMHVGDQASILKESDVADAKTEQVLTDQRHQYRLLLPMWLLVTSLTSHTS